MEQKQTLSSIIESISSEMARLQYAEFTIKEFQRNAKSFSRYVHETTQMDYFTEEIGSEYLKSKIGFPFPKSHVLTPAEAAHIRCVSRIGEYQLHGLFVKRRILKGEKETDWNLDDKKIIDAYLNAVQTADNSATTKKHRTEQILQISEC